MNHCLLWLNMLMYKAVDRSIVRFNPIVEKILSLYNTTDDSKPVFPLGEKKDIYLDVHTLGMVLGISNKLGFHASRHTFGVLMLNEDISTAA